MKRLLAATLLVLAGLASANAATRIKDVSSVQGVRENQLIGYGLVIGLQGTGDTLRNSPFTEQAMQSMLDRLGISTRGIPLRARNVAAVAVTADLPAFAGVGSRIDINVASMGDATSLRGGTLLLTPLTAADGQTYAVAQGQLAVTGFTAEGQAESITQGIPTAARIPNGALVEKPAPGVLNELTSFVLELNNPDFATAARVADVINARFGKMKFDYGKLGGPNKPLAQERDLRSVVVQRPPQMNPARFLAMIGDLPIEPDTPARVVVDQRSGTVVIGRNVKISTVAVTQGNLTVRVTETPEVSQPAPFSDGETVVVPRTDIGIEQDGGYLAVVRGPDLETLVQGLNRMGMRPTDIIAVLQAIKTSGALQADLVVQ
ncbi:flagellar basal body P-ring protein FlgI [Ancylobacter sp. SL191]|jgi:flagellar P-ring protein precursor FlgI|uniref:flagellar basal body P-ring protein FlgI n=1 Tax=Ancylobacter sp. SL191 TaxID=2995166 RepID=UPI00226E112C|nr:flagellar basal body P-ring protein FlgI [Ancylobacter sp. SL191]WAC29026.1 flagellar basal body P-ring protein FlgI [Ancylobacter sp. SL191]